MLNSQINTKRGVAMHRMLLVLILLFVTTNSFAMSDKNLGEYFEGEIGCFILFDVNKDKIINLYNPTRCFERISPESTFKIALSLMAFDKKIINQNTVFKWDGVDRGLSTWNQNQTPYSWLKNSAIWVSQQITPMINKNNINYYLKVFHYGNQDFTGDLDKNNGLTSAWLSSSLKISGNEQMVFLKNLIANKLPVSQEAMRDTKSNMYLETLDNGWKLYGKTGTGFKTISSIDGKNPLQSGWFIGFIEKENKTYIFILNFSDINIPTTLEVGGVRAKNMVKLILNHIDLS